MADGLAHVKAWLAAARPHTLSAAVVPVLVGSAWAAARGPFAWSLFALTCAGAVLVQVGTNLTDEYADHGASASAHKYPAPHKVIARGLLSERAVRRGALVVFGAAAVIGAYLVWRTGWPLLVLCGVSLLLAWSYSAGPLPLGDLALGELVVFVAMGPAMVGGTVYVQLQRLPWGWLWAALPVGCLVTMILIVNSLRDLEEDRRNGRRTLATVFGKAAVRVIYHLLLALAFLCPLAAALGGAGGPWLLLPWLTLPLALRVARWVRAAEERELLHRALKATSALHLLFGLLLALALVVDRAL
ncbi:MAG: 1,4-dihydroxy-2-naphthoate octaprenyltransferase [Candidatus Lambdaproteobacteria bacterium]|nr:1,4-dihydroxy-2-naphthoate octaprenyltransferase [Candidatus Lambdaproteobacteria bacterium]